jgi:hypothetical protein
MQVFLGGACGRTTWRRDIAIPALEAAGISYFNPQLGVGEWSPAREEEEMRAKDLADVLLFVINKETRGVASIGEAAYLLGCGRRLALAVTDITDPSIPADERDDLNRGRIFIRSMAAQNCVPVFPGVEGAVQHAIQLVRSNRLRDILGEVRYRDGTFRIEEIRGGFLIQLCLEEVDVTSGTHETYHGRKWHVPAGATESEIVRTAFKAVETWAEHEARELFTYRGVPVFGPHFDVRDLARLFGRK